MVFLASSRRLLFALTVLVSVLAHDITCPMPSNLQTHFSIDMSDVFFPAGISVRHPALANMFSASKFSTAGLLLGVEEAPRSTLWFHVWALTTAMGWGGLGDWRVRPCEAKAKGRRRSAVVYLVGSCVHAFGQGSVTMCTCEQR